MDSGSLSPTAMAAEMAVESLRGLGWRSLREREEGGKRADAEEEKERDLAEERNLPIVRVVAMAAPGGGAVPPA